MNDVSTIRLPTEKMLARIDGPIGWITLRGRHITVRAGPVVGGRQRALRRDHRPGEPSPI